MLDAPDQGMTSVDRAFALAAAPAPRAAVFDTAGGHALAALIALRASYAILPRRLTLETEAGERLVLLLRRRRLVGIAEAAPASLWAGGELPARVGDDEEGDALALAAADTLATLMARAPSLSVRFSFPQMGEDTTSEGLEIEALLEPLVGGLPSDAAPQGRAGLMASYYDRVGGMARVMLTPERQIDLPGGTPEVIRKLFDGLGPANLTGAPGDAPEVVMFEQGERAEKMTVKVADEGRLCLVHAQSGPEVEALLAATWQLKRALDRAAAGGSDAPPLH